jgi:lipopolysaccharide export system permease protein
MLTLHGGVLLLNLAWLSARQNNWGRASLSEAAPPRAPQPKIEPTT